MSVIVIHKNAGRGCAIFCLGAFARVAGRLGVGCFEYRTAFPNLLGLLARFEPPADSKRFPLSPLERLLRKSMPRQERA